MSDNNVKYYPFWRCGSCVQINSSRLIKFLADQGFGNFQTQEGRTHNSILFFNNSGMLELHSPDSLKRFLIGFIEDDESLGESEKEEVQDRIVKLAPSTIGNYIQTLPLYSENSFSDTKKLNIFKDDKNNCYIPFNNGVVHITPKDIKLIDRKSIIDKGCIWESSILNHDITIQDKYMVSQNNPFKDFITYALKKDVTPNPDKNDINLGTDTERYKSTLSAFETGFGYMIHSYNPPQEQKMVVFVDVDSSPERTEGGNGKSLGMSQIQNFRKTAFVNGKQFRKSLNDSSRFNFSNVKLDTGFVLINDLNPDFDLTQMFSDITDDMTIEGKGTNKIVIPKERKPKMGATTNYVITGVGQSYERRQHIVEFGNFWNKCSQLGIATTDIIKKVIPNDFDKNDWDGFYNYGFMCVQRYLREGLVKQSVSSYAKKNLISVIEGISGNGDVTEWIENFVNDNTEISSKDGLMEETIYKKFTSDNPSFMVTWDMKKLLDGMFNYVSQNEKLDWNPEFSKGGNTRSKRRWRKGERGQQKNFVRIVSV